VCTCVCASGVCSSAVTAFPTSPQMVHYHPTKRSKKKNEDTEKSWTQLSSLIVSVFFFSVLSVSVSQLIELRLLSTPNRVNKRVMKESEREGDLL
jgi:hypothetical protein